MVTEQTTTIRSFNPATGELLGEAPCFSKTRVAEVVDDAWKAFELWRLTDFPIRQRRLNALRKVIFKSKEDLAQLISREVGKPLVESLMAELTATLEASAWFASNCERLLRDQVLNLTNPILLSKQSLVCFDPVGVVGIIAPWNYPFAIPMMQAIMAIAVGNTVVLKPSEKCPLLGIRIGELFLEAGFPPGVVSIITGDRETGKHLTGCRLARIIFTGSVESGSKVMEQAARQLTPVTLELGGKDPAIVLADAPVDWTARGLTWSAFTNCGQACASTERVYLIKGRHTDELLNKIVSYTRALKLGPGHEIGTDVGPLIDQGQLKKVQDAVEEAIAQGARVLCGGRTREDLGGCFFEPTVIVDVNHQMELMKEETFGPVLPVMVVDSEDEAVELANDSIYGLSASVWGRNLARCEDVARDLECGSVWINDALFSFACPQAPWGGVKKSGIGRTHSYFGLLDLVNIKHISIDSAGGGHRPWWYPYSHSGLEATRGGLDLLHGHSPLTKLAGLCRYLTSGFRRP